MTIFFRPSVKFFLYSFFSIFFAANLFSAPRKYLNPGEYLAANEKLSHTSGKVNLPLQVKSFYDLTGNIECANLDDKLFSLSEQKFNPSFYSGALWLEIEFQDTIDKYGPYYSLTFGAEHIDCAELYIEKNGRWILYGETGRSIPRKQMSSPIWILNIPLNMLDMEKQNGPENYRARIRFISYTGAPVNLNLYTQRQFYSYLYIFTTFVFFLLGVCLIISIAIFVFGIVFRDKIYILLGLASFLVLCLLVNLTGVGSIYLWNGLSTKVSSQKIMYIFADTMFCTLIADYLMITKENKINEEVKITSFIMIALIVLNSISVFFVRSPAVMHITFCINMILCCFVFAGIIIRNSWNKANRTTTASIIFSLWPIAFFTEGVITSFILIRTFSKSRIFTIFDNEHYMFFFAGFMIITLPAIYLNIQRESVKIDHLNRTIKSLKHANRKLSNQKKMTEKCMNTLLKLNLNAQNFLHLPELKTENHNAQQIIKILKRTNIQGTDLLTTLCIMNNSMDPKDCPILIQDFFNECLNFVRQYSSTKQNTLSIKNAISTDCCICAQNNLLEFIYTTFIFSIMQVAYSSSKIELNFYNNLNDFILSGTINADTDMLLRIRKFISEEKHPEGNSYYDFEILKEACKIYGGKFSLDVKKEVGIFTLKMNFNFYTPSERSMIKGTLFTEEDNCINYYNTIQDMSLKKSVYIIEENAEQRMFIENLLKNDFKTSSFPNGTDAWNALQENLNSLPDLIITNSDLPLLSGQELFAKCNDDPQLKNVHFIFILNLTERQLYDTLMQKGAAAVIKLPLQKNELYNTIMAVANTDEKVKNKLFSKINKLVHEGENISVTETAVQEIEQIDTPDTGKMNLTNSQSGLFANSNLSNREKQIAYLIAAGKTDKEIAASLNISPATVATHNKKIFKKIGVHSRVELINKVR